MPPRAPTAGRDSPRRPATAPPADAGAGLGEGDRLWLARLEATVRLSIGDRDLDERRLAGQLGVEVEDLNLDLHRLLGLTLDDLLAEVRLTDARAMIFRGQVTSLAEAAVAVGTDEATLNRLYTNRFGHAPDVDMEERSSRSRTPGSTGSRPLRQAMRRLDPSDDRH